MNRTSIVLAVAVLTGCGGGGGGGSGSLALPASVEPAVAAPAAATPLPAPVAPAPVEAPAVTVPHSVNARCTTTGGPVSCDLEANDQAISVDVPAGTSAFFTNRTGTYLQIDQVSADTGEQKHWAEYCVYLNVFGDQATPGAGEVGCTTKNPGENFPPVTWGGGTGLSVAPGGVVYLNAHTEPAAVAYTYSMKVRAQTSGLNSWRQPRKDAVIPCSGQSQATEWTPWQNTTGHNVHLVGVSTYSVSGTSTPDTLNGPACIFVLNPNGTPRYTNCDDALRTRRADVSTPGIVIAPGEFVGAQATNACGSPGAWDWAAYLHVWTAP